jgi:hypothetical protein
MSRTLIAGCAVFLSTAVGASAQTGTCEVPDHLTKEQKLPCVRAAGIALNQPSLTPAELQNGPDFDAAHPDASRFEYFTETDDVLCYFRPHYAFKEVKGVSLKFQCWRMTPSKQLMGKRGQPIAETSVKVVIDSKKSGEKSADLYPAGDTANTHEIKADRFKVKYLLPAFPDENTRYNEVFTEVAATRIMWLLGLPADHVYPVGSVECVGCTADPFGKNLQVNTSSLQDLPTTFKMVSAEREAPWDEIKSGDDETWSWADAAKFYSTVWTHQQKVEYDAYRLALGLFHYHNAIDQQNRLVCAEWGPEVAGHPKTCTRPMIFVQDLGSTFGKEKSPLNFFGTNSRGRYKDWQAQTVFADPQTCELRATLGGQKRVLKEAQDLMISRLGVLDEPTVRTIFRVARFEKMDQEQLGRLRASGAQDVEKAALDEWTHTFLERVNEIRTARNCAAS